MSESSFFLEWYLVNSERNVLNYESKSKNLLKETIVNREEDIKRILKGNFKARIAISFYGEFQRDTEIG